MLPRSRAHYMIFSSSHDHGPALSFFHTATITGQFHHFLKQPRSRACVIIFFFFYTATITGQFYHFLKQPRSRVCVNILFFIYCHDHGPVLSFTQAATNTGLRYHFILPRSRASFIISSSSHDHGPALSFLFFFFFFLYRLDHGPDFPFSHAASITGQRIIFKQPRSRACIIM